MSAADRGRSLQRRAVAFAALALIALQPLQHVLLFWERPIEQLASAADSKASAADSKATSADSKATGLGTEVAELQTKPQQLPRTGSPLPLIGLLGMLSLAGSFGLRTLR